MGVIAIGFSLMSLSVSLFGPPGTSPNKSVVESVKESDPVPEVAPEQVQPMPETMVNPSVEDIHKLAASAGRVVYFSYHIMPGADLPVSVSIEYPGVGFNRIDLDGLNNSHLYFQLNEALKAAGKIQ